MNTQHKLLCAALTAALFSAAPVFSQDSGTTGTETTESSSVPKDRLVDRYSEAAGSDAAAADLVTSLRDGDDLTVTTTTTTTTTNPDGTTTTTTSTSDVVIENPNGPMGWGEVDKALGIAEKLVDDGKFENLEDALAGSPDITNPDGTVIEGSSGILQLRADGMGWGQIAKEYDFKLGSVVGNGKASRDTEVDGEVTTTTTRTQTAGKVSAGSERSAKAERAAKAERTAKAERVAKVERVARVERPDRPDRVERPAKPERPERPERPQKPERSGRP
jgi:hypothetical protein